MNSNHADDSRGGDRLNGWKEIAAFLGKGVRTVQRWEEDYQLPIHRVGREGGEIVFAFKSEIDEWSRRRRSAQNRTTDASVVDESTQHQKPRFAYVVGITVLGLTAAALMIAAPGLLHPVEPQPTRGTVDATALRIFDSRGNEIWHHSFDFNVSIADYQGTARHRGAQPLVFADLDGDATTEVVFAERSLIRDRTRTLFIFNHDGTVRARIDPKDSVTFGSQEYAGPWAIFRMFVTDNPDETKSVWVAYIHGSDFPTLLLEIDGKTGREKSRYWSNGYVDSLLVTRWKGRPVVLVGATNNDTRGASLAVFDYGRVTGSAPAAQQAYQCTNCPSGEPTEFFIFPLRCIGRAIHGTASVGDLWMDAVDGLHVMVWEGPMDYAASAWYVLSPDAHVRSAQYVDTTRGYHDQKNREGVLDHPFSESDQRDLLPLARWTGGGFAPAAAVTNQTSR
jgi:hypothetical protein